MIMMIIIIIIIITTPMLTRILGFAGGGGAECLYELLVVVFGPQLLLDMWLPRSIGCSRGCGTSSCNHACESLLAWTFGVDCLGVDLLGVDFFVRRGFLGVDF